MMPKQEKIAWILGAGSFLIASNMLRELLELLTVEDGLVTAGAGLLSVCLKVIIAGIFFESIGEFIRRRPSEEVDMDERDKDIHLRADRFGLWIFAFLVVGSIFSLVGWQMAGITAVRIAPMAGCLIFAMVVANLGRHVAEIYQYKVG